MRKLTVGSIFKNEERALPEWLDRYLRQNTLYDKHILPRIEETHWLLMVDLEEFVWSPRGVDLRRASASPRTSRETSSTSATGGGRSA